MPLRISIVEDNPDTLKSLKTFLERRGHTVQSSCRMEEAFAKIVPAECDLLLCDIGLPDGDGWELMRRLQGNPPRYSVAMSGYGTAADMAQSHSVGFQLHLVKPVTKTQMDDMLARAEEAKDAVGGLHE